ncbi:tRNA lysidine(34) synthetase TilS [bacterium]|nr:tRNA lysidine(34) synthetase TilS [bacterium]
MNKIHLSIKNFLRNYDLENSKLLYLVAFSGGFDSMCLLHSLSKICPKNKIIAIHLNHNWRGEESDREEQNCKIFCQNIGIEFYSEKITVPQNETESRNIRYEFFERCSKKFGSKIIFTAHNKNDNAETLIFRIAHGTGIKGLCGISPNRGIYYRPILDIERCDIENYCKENNLIPNIDSSNKDNIHKRNFIRNKILPDMAEINKNIVNSLNSLSQIAKYETELLNEYVKNTLFKISKNGKIMTSEFLQLSKGMKMKILYDIITPFVPQNYDKKRIKTVLKFIEENNYSKSGKTVSITSDKWLFVSAKYIEVLNIKEKKEVCIHVNKIGQYEDDGIFITVAECSTETDRVGDTDGQSVLVDVSGLDFDFELRTRRDGDIIQPAGMLGHKKLKKYLNEKKIPNHKKDELLFLAQGKEILWAVGLGLSEKVKVKSIPTHIIKVERIQK